jgi:hypothetical protein
MLTLTQKNLAKTTSFDYSIPHALPTLVQLPQVQAKVH